MTAESMAMCWVKQWVVKTEPEKADWLVAEMESR